MQPRFSLSPSPRRLHGVNAVRLAVLLAVVTSVLGGCAIERIVRSNESMRSDMKSEPQQIKEDMVPRIEQSKALGPVVKETPPEELRRQNRSLLGTFNQDSEIQRELSAAGQTFTISLNLMNVDMRDIGRLFAEVAKTNILVGEEVKSRVTAKIMDTPWDIALDGILKIHGLSWTFDRQHNLVRIHSQETLDKRIEAERKRIEDMRKAAEGRQFLESRRTEIFRLYYTKPGKLKDGIQALFKSAGQSAASVEVVVDERTNSLIIKGTEAELDLVSKLIEKLDVRTRQILIEAFIVEALDNFQDEFGVRTGWMWQDGNTLPSVTVGGASGTTSAGTAANVAGDMTFATNSGLITSAPVAGAAIGSVGAMIQRNKAALKIELMALEKLGLSKIISNPRVFTMDNEEATITDGTQIPYPVAGTGAGQITYEFKDAALKLVVTPTIVGDGNIQLTVTVNKDSPNYSTTPPSIDKREIKSRLLIKDGAIAVIGGIYSQTKAGNVNKVPGLGDIPVLGILFRNNSQKDERRELFIFISPNII